MLVPSCERWNAQTRCPRLLISNLRICELVTDPPGVKPFVIFNQEKPEIIVNEVTPVAQPKNFINAGPPNSTELHIESTNFVSAPVCVVRGASHRSARAASGAKKTS